MNSTKSVEINGLFPSLLFITFLVLKLTSVIDWSWWFVTAPLWVPSVFALILLLIVTLGFGAGKAFERGQKNRTHHTHYRK